MKKLIVVVVCVLLLGSAASADPKSNPAFLVPQIGAITCDGDLSDWAASSGWSAEYGWWIGTEGHEWPGNETYAQFAWNDADDMLYVGVQTNQNYLDYGDPGATPPLPPGEDIGGHMVLGVGLPGGDPTTAVGCTQLMFDLDGIGASGIVNIGNEIQYFKDTYGITTWAGGGTTGVQGGAITTGTDASDMVTTYEVAIPLWANWTVMTNKQALSIGTMVDLYGVMETKLEGTLGTGLNDAGNAGYYMGNWDVAAEITLVPEPATIALLGLGGLALLRKRS